MTAKPCAHCGSEPLIIRLNDGLSLQIRCKNCGIRTPYGNEEYVFRTWNRRQEELIEHVASSEEQMGYEK